MVHNRSETADVSGDTTYVLRIATSRKVVYARQCESKHRRLRYDRFESNNTRNCQVLGSGQSAMLVHGYVEMSNQRQR